MRPRSPASPSVPSSTSAEVRRSAGLVSARWPAGRSPARSARRSPATWTASAAGTSPEPPPWAACSAPLGGALGAVAGQAIGAGVRALGSGLRAGMGRVSSVAGGVAERAFGGARREEPLPDLFERFRGRKASRGTRFDQRHGKPGGGVRPRAVAQLGVAEQRDKILPKPNWRVTRHPGVANGVQFPRGDVPILHTHPTFTTVAADLTANVSPGPDRQRRRSLTGAI